MPLSQADQAWSDQYDREQAAKQAQEVQPKQPPSFLQQVTAPVGRATLSTLDAAMSTAESYFNSDAGHKARDLVAGGIKGVAEDVDAARAGEKELEDKVGVHPPISLANIPQPIWDHAKQHIMDFRDAVAVQDPTMVDKGIQDAGQFLPAYSLFSRAVAGLHWAANAAISGFGAEALSADPGQHRITQDLPRIPDIYAAGQHTQSKYIEALQQASNVPGELVNHFVNYIASTGGSDAEERFKNGIEGAITNTVATPLFHAVGVTLKHSFEGLRYAMENGVGSVGDFPKDPAAMSEQAGKIVFHGTGADFDKFDSSKIGTGEGNQTFGHGLYFAENPETAGTYQKMLVNRSVGVGADLQDARQAVKSQGGPARAYKALTENAANEADPVQRQRLQRLAQLVKSGNYTKGGGNLMHVDIPDEHINNMIDWDRSISEQPNLQSALKDLDVKVVPGPNRDFQVMVGGKENRELGPRYMTRAAAEAETALLRGEGHDQEAGMAYRQLSEALHGTKAASEYLDSKGIPGIRYLDQVSRASGKGTRNIVLFNDKHATIVKKE